MNKLSWIYVWKDKTNGLSYVGQAKDFDDRMKRHLRSKGKYRIHFDNVFQKRQKDFELIELLLVKKENLDYWEQQKIKECNSLYPNGYNHTSGGDGGDTFTDNPNKEKIIKKMKKSRKRFLSTLEGKQQAKECSEKLKNFYQTLEGKKLKEKWSKERGGKNNSFWKKRHNKKTRKIMSEKKKGKYIGANHPRAREVLFISPNGQKFQTKSYKPFCKEHKLNVGHIWEVLNNRRPYCKGWKAIYLD